MAPPGTYQTSFTEYDWYSTLKYCLNLAHSRSRRTLCAVEVHSVKRVLLRAQRTSYWRCAMAYIELQLSLRMSLVVWISASTRGMVEAWAFVNQWHWIWRSRCCRVRRVHRSGVGFLVAASLGECALESLWCSGWSYRRLCDVSTRYR
jgi:hypothetical protein